MRFHSVAILTGATAAAATSTTSLFLPGYQGHDLQASVIGSKGDATTYLVTCPQATPKACNIRANGGLTVTAAPTSAQLVEVDKNGNTALVSCNVAGTTSASCSASNGAVTVQHTLAASRINWQPVTITDCSSSTPTPTSTSTPTSTPSSTRTPTSTPKSSSTPLSSSKKPSSSSHPTSTPLVPTPAPQPSDGATGSAGTAVPTESATPSSSTPVGTGAAAALSGNSWLLSGAAMLAYVLV